MNLVLFEQHETGTPIPREDRRVRHVLTVLRRGTGELFDAGIVNGPRGKAAIVAATDEGVTFSFSPTAEPPPLPAIRLIVGLPRPQTARDILRDATTLGVASIDFVRTEKTEPGYAQSTLWSSGEWRRQVLAGAEQAFDTRLPEVTHGRTLADVITELGVPSSGAAETRLALDNYESAEPLASGQPAGRIVFAIGAERGWSAAERQSLRAAGFKFVHLGPRVLRTETAVIAALAVVGRRDGGGT
ncbi:MAG TPA: RsmE family RNA methyltransferase [Opitutaceae bacterium]|nr:RsmE family RNA methyltransferase [Opitutaceae bacterium]